MGEGVVTGGDAGVEVAEESAAEEADAFVCLRLGEVKFFMVVHYELLLLVDVSEHKKGQKGKLEAVLE